MERWADEEVGGYLCLACHKRQLKSDVPHVMARANSNNELDVTDAVVLEKSIGRIEQGINLYNQCVKDKHDVRGGCECNAESGG